MYDTHVYLGPSLDLETAMHLLPNAHYHPPVQCGDIIRLLRIKPRRIVIIDGLYEHVPAVWHKEILLALELHVEIWGASSMGALRAAELHQYGMRGVGEVFQAFKTGALCDDDEVAVLHQGKAQGYLPMNDAMINIRATCAKALEAGVIDLEMQRTITAFCKNQFYPYRSLISAVKQLLVDDPIRYKAFDEWIAKQGIVNVKRQDAMLVLSHVSQSLNVHSTPATHTPMTIFLNELTQYVNVTPFSHQADWLPEEEKQLQALYSTSPKNYMLVAEVAYFAKKLKSFASQDSLSLDNDALLDYMQQHHLYSPVDDFARFDGHPILSDVYLSVCQSICIEHLTNDTINQYIDAAAHYFDLEVAVVTRCETLLRALCLLLLSLNVQFNQRDSLLTKKTWVDHLAALSKSRGYHKERFNQWLNPTHIEPAFFMRFVVMYVKISRAYPSKMQKEPVYFNWIYDAVSLSS